MASKKEEEQRDQCNQLDLLMIGKSGHGKSSTANSILGKRTFTATMDTGSDPYKVGAARIGDRDINIVDCPGLYNPSCKSQEDSVKLFIKAITESFSRFPGGFHALLLVFSYTARMTEEEKDAIKALRSILGNDVIRNHVVCVLTNGDSFLNDHEDVEDFQAWCQEHGVYKELFEECQQRFVLFDNMTRNADEKEAQISKLLSKIDSLKVEHYSYTESNFEGAAITREDFLIELRLPTTLKLILDQVAVLQRDLFAKSGSLEQLSELKAKVVDLEKRVPKGFPQKTTEACKEITYLLGMIDVYNNMLSENKDMHTNFTINTHVAPGKKREKVKRASLLLEKYSREIGLLKDALHKIMILPSAERFEKIEELKLRAATLLEDLSKEDDETLTNITADVWAISDNIHIFEGLIAQQEQNKVHLAKAVDDIKAGDDSEIAQMKARMTEQQNIIDELHGKLNTQIDTIKSKVEEISIEETDGCFASVWDSIKKAGAAIVSLFEQKHNVSATD